MILLKSDREIELMKEAGHVVALCHAKLADFIKPGLTTMQIDLFVERIIKENGGKASFKGYQGFPASTCVSVNDVVVHGIPGGLKIKNGDIVSVDIGVYLNGYHADSAWTYPVGIISPEVKQLLEVTEKSLFAGINKAIEGNCINDISVAIEEVVKPFNYGIVEELTGHGVGQELHEEPYVPNYDTKQPSSKIMNGLVIAIEPMINLGTKNISHSRDGWTIRTKDRKYSAHFEHTVAVTSEGPIIITQLQKTEA
jgi:methionyl aminopeptidase